MTAHNQWFHAAGVTGPTEKGHYQNVIEALKKRGVALGRTKSRGRYWKNVRLDDRVMTGDDPVSAR